MSVAILEIENNYSWLLTEDKLLKKSLWETLRFRERNYFHNRRYKMKLWDGYVDFFKINTGRFLTGLLPEIQLALRSLGVEVLVKDKRKQFEFGIPAINKYFLKEELGIELRDYQVEFVNQLLKHKRGVIPSPTASGKTNTMLALLKAMPRNSMSLVVANRKSLIEQNYDEIVKLGLDVGRFYGEKNKQEIKTITCTTIQSAEKLVEIFPNIKGLFVDEIHRGMSKEYKSLYASLSNTSVRIAMSATPFKYDGADQCQKYEVKGWFGPILLAKESSETGKIGTQELIERNILSKATCTFYPIDQPKLPHCIYIDAVTKGIAENDYFHDIVTRLATGLTGRSLIIVERIEHGDRLADRIPGLLWVRGQDNMNTRKEVIEQLKTHKGNVIACATKGIFTDGINVFLHNLINAFSSKAAHDIIQAIGRGLRKADDKVQLNYYDFLFQINDYLNKHSLQRIKILQKEGHELIIKNNIDF